MEGFDEAPPIEKLASCDIRMEYLTYDARKALKISGLDGKLNLYWQCTVIQLCNNFTLGNVIKALMPFARSDMSPHDFMEKGHFLVEKSLGKRKDNLEFTAKSMWGLYLIDQKMLVADYFVQLSNLLEYLEEIAPADIDEIAASVGRTRMSVVMGRMASTLFEAKEAFEQLKNAPVTVITPKVKVSKKGIEFLKKALIEINQVKEE